MDLLFILLRLLVSFFNPVLGVVSSIAFPVLQFLAPVIASVLEKVLPDLITKHWKWGHKQKTKYLKKLKKQSKRKK